SLSWAAPPMWKVRIVSCVPGSPIDWAAITPTASDVDRRAARKVAPVALGADALLGRTNQRAADLHALESDLFDLGDHRLVEQLALRDDRLARLGIDD